MRLVQFKDDDAFPASDSQLNLHCKKLVYMDSCLCIQWFSVLAYDIVLLALLMCIIKLRVSSIMILLKSGAHLFVLVWLHFRL